jgi:Secretion system C-terminal sorting domain
MKMKYMFCVACGLIGLVNATAAQWELEKPLTTNPALHGVRPLSSAERGSEVILNLPFFDDFSKFSLPSDATEMDALRWQDRTAFINNTLGISPFTIGVATLDGLNEVGYPYVFDEETVASAPCDTLTSLSIDLSTYDAEDQVYLLFHIQNGGLGNAAEAGDSIVLEFFTPFNSGVWTQVWSMHGGAAMSHFDTVFVAVNEAQYFVPNFKFRFRNFGTPTGAIDQWHLDYIFLNNGLDPNNAVYDEVAFQYPSNTLLNYGLTAMPWTHFLSDPSGNMADTWRYYQRNSGGPANIATTWTVSLEGSNQHTSIANINPTANGYSEFFREVEMEDYVFEDAGNVTCASFEVCAQFSQTDAQLTNDTTCFVQHLKNYYAYDDGSAERAYSLDFTGAQLAMKFDAQIEDSLLGVFIYWIPFEEDASDQSFFLRVWDNEGNAPGSELGENFSFLYPNYDSIAHNGFLYYPLDAPIAVSGPFFIGWIQQNTGEYSIGNDKNTNQNIGRLFYKFPGEEWTGSIVTGSLMIRPVFRSGKADWSSVTETPASPFSVYPNPTSEQVYIQCDVIHDRLDMELIDVVGQMVRKESFGRSMNVSLDLSQLPAGVYHLRLICDGIPHVTKIIKN